MSNATDFAVGRSKPRKRRLSAKQKASSLFHLWHSIQDVKEEAEQMNDEERPACRHGRTAGRGADGGPQQGPRLGTFLGRYDQAKLDFWRPLLGALAASRPLAAASRPLAAAYSGTASLSIRAWPQRRRLASTRGSAAAVTPRTTA